MGFSCAFNIKTKDVTDIIGEGTIKGLNDLACKSAITVLSNNLKIPAEDLLNKKYKQDIINFFKDTRFEVSSKGNKLGKQFSAHNAKFTEGFHIKDADGKLVYIKEGTSIEDAYQKYVKKSGKNKKPSKKSVLYNEDLTTTEELEDFSYEKGYLPLWQMWASQHSDLIEELREKSKGKILMDQFAKTRVNQARALTDILNGNTEIKELISKSDNTDTQSESKKKRNAKREQGYKESLESAKTERPVFDSVKIGEIQQKVLSIAFPNVAERVAATEFISNLFSLILDDTIEIYKHNLEENVDSIRDILGDEEYQRLYNGLYQGTVTQQRLFFLSYEFPGQKSLPLQIFDRIENIINNFKNAEEKDIDFLLYNYFLNKNNTINTNSYLGKEFSYEAAQRGWDTAAKIEKEARNRVRYLMNYFKNKFQSDQVFDALVKDAAITLEFNEGIRLDTRGNITENSKEEQDRELDVETEQENPNKEGYMINYRFVNPIDTISERLKKELSNMYRMRTSKEGDPVFVFNSLGTRVRLNPMVAYYIMLEEFQTISSEDELNGMFEDAVNKYPWMRPLKDKVVFNPENPKAFNLDFRKEFFRSCKSFGAYYVVQDGKLSPLNRSNQNQTFLEAVKKSYEGHEVYGENSIWNTDGTINHGNVEKTHNLLRMPRKKDGGEVVTNLEKKHPLRVALRGMFSNKEKITSTKEAIQLERAIQILRGEHPKFPRVSLEALLKNLGIDTSGLDILTMLPITEAFNYNEEGYILNEEGEPLTESDIASKGFNPSFSEDFLIWAEEQGMQPIEAFNSIITDKMRKNISSILEAAEVITSPAYGINASSSEINVVTVYQSQYLIIGNALSLVNEGYSESSFRFAGNSRFSYTAYNFITRMSNLITKTDTQEQWDRGTQYLYDKYGQYDFFKNQRTEEWYNIWLQQLYEDSEIRKEFKIFNVLGFGGNEERDTFGKVEDSQLLHNMIVAFFNGGKTANNGYGVYRSALFSDVDATVLIKGIRYSANFNNNQYYDSNDTERKHPLTWKQIIVRNLSKVLRQEIDRIVDLEYSDKDENTTKIEYYNSGKKNGLKFNFFPTLNEKSKYEKILNKYKELVKSKDPVSIDEELTEFLESIIIDIIEGEINPQTGDREGGKLQEFLNMFDSFQHEDLEKLIDDIDTANFESKEEDKQETEEEDEVRFEKKKKEKSDEEKQEEIERLRALLTEFFYNDYFAQSQIIQIFGGDLAFYKNFKDFIKRYKQVFAAGDRVYGMEMDEQGNNIKPLVERSLYLEDKYEVSNSYKTIVELLNSNVGVSNITRDMILGALNSYKSINATDGQSFRSPAGMKKILQAMGGKWTESMEQSYQRLQNGKFGLEDFYTIWNNIKPFLYSHETVQVGDRKEKVITQHKNSEYMLTSFFNLIGGALSQSPQLKALNEFMEENDIDVVHFHSVVKEGFFNGVDLNYDKERFEEAKDDDGYIKVAGIDVAATTYEEYKNNLIKLLDEGSLTQEQVNEGLSMVDFTKDEDGVDAVYNQLYDAVMLEDEEGNVFINEEMVHEVPLSDYMMVQPSGDHLTEDDLTALFGSQLRNIMPADLPASFSIEIDFNGQKKTLNRDEYVKFYNTLIVDQLLDSFSMVNEQFSSIDKLQAALLNKIHGNPKYGPEVEEALQLNEDGTGFRIPFNNPNLNNKIEELILSTFKNNIQKQKINGGNIVLVSNFGLSDSLHIKWKTDENGNKSIDYIPCYMPAYKRTLIQDLLVEKYDAKTGEAYWEVDYNKTKGNEDLLRMIGYRIPTENKYSIFNLRIQGFLPISAGTAIMLPSDIITMSGTDFDIDKLFLMLKNFRREVTDDTFTKAFSEYLNRRKKRSKDTESKHIDKGFHLLELMQKNNGITEEDLNYFLDHYSIFEEFYDDEGYELLLSTPNYVSLKPKVTANMSLEDISKQKELGLKTRKKVRDNMLIDIIAAGLSSNAGSQMSMIPGSFTDIEHASRLQRIAKDPKAINTFIEKYKVEIGKYGLYETLLKYGKNTEEDTTRDSIDALENFHEQYATVEDPLSIVDYIKNHRNLMDGNDLIGIFAVSSSSHYKYQFINNGRGLSIAEDYQFNISLDGEKTFKVTNIDSVVSPFTGVKIGDYCAQYQAAAPDNGKNPSLGDMNANPQTAARVSFLTRIGLDPDTVSVLNTSDDFTDNMEKLVQINKDYKKDYKNWKNFHGNIARIFNLVTKFRLYGLDSLSVDELKEGVQFAGWMNNIKELSSLLNESTCISRCDSPNGALAISTAEVSQQLMKDKSFIEKVTKRENGKLIANPSSPIQGFEQFIDIELDAVYDDNVREKILNSAVPRVQAAYTLGIRSGYTLSSKYNILPQLSKNVESALNYLRIVTRNNLNSKRNTKVIRQFYNELVTYLLSGEDSRFGSDKTTSILEKRNYYIHDFPVKYKIFMNEKTKDGKYKHARVKNMTIFKCLKISARSGITFQNVGKVSQNMRKYFSEELNQLLTSTDPEEVRFAEDLFNYAYYAHGFNFGPHNYGIFLSNVFYENMPRYLEVLKARNAQLAIYTEDNSYLINYVNQFIANNFSYAPRLKNFNRHFDISKDNQGTTTLTIKKGLGESISNAYKQITTQDGKYLLPFVVIPINKYIGLYYMTGKNAEGPVYTKIQHNYKDTPFYDSTKEVTEIKFSEMKKFGNPTNIKKVMENIDENTDENTDADVEEKLSAATVPVNDIDEDSLLKGAKIPWQSEDYSVSNERLLSAANAFIEEMGKKGALRSKHDNLDDLITNKNVSVEDNLC